MGAATHFNKNKGKYISIFRHVVNGVAKNVYSKNDDVLKLYILSENQWHPAGREPILLFDPRDKQAAEERENNQNTGNPYLQFLRKKKDKSKESELKISEDLSLILNFDITENVITSKIHGMGHTDYMDYYVQQELYFNIDLWFGFGLPY